MIKNENAKIALWILEVLLIIFQAGVILLGVLGQYFLIYQWIFYGVNYLIIIIPCLLYSKNKYLTWAKLIIAIVLFTVNTTFFYYMGNTNLIIDKSQDKKHEVILKEYKNSNYETIRLKRRWVIFGKKVDTLIGSSKYKTIEKGTYKIDWVSGDTAVINYTANVDGVLQQSIISFRSTNYISYVNVLPSLNGKWIEKDNSKNYFMYTGDKLVYAKDGQLYYYNTANTKQQGVTAIVIKGDSTKPSLTVVLNSDCVIGSDCLINPGGTITINEITLEKTESKSYSREK